MPTKTAGCNTEGCKNRTEVLSEEDERTVIQISNESGQYIMMHIFRMLILRNVRKPRAILLR